MCKKPFFRFVCCRHGPVDGLTGFKSKKIKNKTKNKKKNKSTASLTEYQLILKQMQHNEILAKTIMKFVEIVILQNETVRPTRSLRSFVRFLVATLYDTISVSNSVGHLFGRSVGRSVGLSVGRSVVRLVVRSVGPTAPNPAHIRLVFPE